MKKPASLSSIQYGGRDKGKTASRKTGTEAEGRAGAGQLAFRRRWSGRVFLQILVAPFDTYSRML